MESFVDEDTLFLTIARLALPQGVIESFDIRSWARIFPDRFVSLARKNFFRGGPKICVRDDTLSVNGSEEIPQTSTTSFNSTSYLQP